MKVKQIFLTLIVLFAISSVATSQVKKQYRDNVDKSTTVVIKKEGANDLDILNSQFNLDDFAVNEQIRITTDQQALPSTSNNLSGGKSMLLSSQNLSNTTASTNYERPKTKMRRWSVREKKEPKTPKAISVETSKKETTTTKPATPTTKSSSTKKTGTAKKTSSRKYRKKSKKVKKKKRVRKLKNRKRKIRRNKRGACYKF